MSAISVSPPFPVFTDVDGTPIENGSIYIGVANLNPMTNPIQVYWDTALTAPVAQPVKTSGGYPVRNGTPARLYLNSTDYSMVVKDRRGATVYSSLTSTEKISLDQVTGNFDASRVNYTAAAIGSQTRTLQKRLGDALNVKDFGALGDGTGRTPADDGVDIMSASWNTWNGTPFKDNIPYSPMGIGGTFNPTRAKPFANDDTWDYIGISLSLWRGALTSQAAYLPAGRYVINLSSATPKGPFNGLLIMKGMEQAIFGDGPYESTLVPKEASTFFDANSPNSLNAYQLLTLYRIGGPPTNIHDIALVGPDSYSATTKNLSLIWAQNINGVTFHDLWLSSAWRGISVDTSSGDSHLRSTTTEYLFGQSVYTDATSDLSIDFCNFWSSAVIAGQSGVTALGRTSVTNSRFVNFYGQACIAASGVFAHNLVTGPSGSDAVTFTGNAVVSGNQFTCDTAGSQLKVGPSSSVTGNVFTQGNQHSCVNVGTGTAGSAANISITGNVFTKTDATVAPANYAILAEVAGSNYTGAATVSLLITNNTFSGRAMTTIGAATMVTNTFDGTSCVSNGYFTQNGDVAGRESQTGTNAGTPYTITINTTYGYGQGGTRDQQRLNLVSVVSTTSGHVVRGWALCTSQYDGSMVLLSTLCKSEVGGTIVFSVSGNNLVATITNSAGGTAAWTVHSIPLM